VHIFLALLCSEFLGLSFCDCSTRVVSFGLDFDLTACESLNFILQFGGIVVTSLK
jgi:hypothetical protein